MKLQFLSDILMLTRIRQACTVAELGCAYSGQLLSFTKIGQIQDVEIPPL